MRPTVLTALLVTTIVVTSSGGLFPATASPCTPATRFAGVVLETGCLEEILDICDAYLNDEMHRLPEHQQHAVCMR